MILPELPKKYNKKEADFGTEIFKPWVEKNGEMSCTYELKDSRGKDYILLNEIKDEQRDHAERVKWSQKGCLIRVTVGNPGAPDYCFYKNSPAYIVIKYPKLFVIVDIDTINMLKEKRLSIEKAKQIAYKIVIL